MNMRMGYLNRLTSMRQSLTNRTMNKKVSLPLQNTIYTNYSNTFETIKGQFRQILETTKILLESIQSQLQTFLTILFLKRRRNGEERFIKGMNDFIQFFRFIPDVVINTHKLALACSHTIQLQSQPISICTCNLVFSTLSSIIWKAIAVSPVNWNRVSNGNADMIPEYEREQFFTSATVIFTAKY